MKRKALAQDQIDTGGLWVLLLALRDPRKTSNPAFRQQFDAKVKSLRLPLLIAWAKSEGVEPKNFQFLRMLHDGLEQASMDLMVRNTLSASTMKTIQWLSSNLEYLEALFVPTAYANAFAKMAKRARRAKKANRVAVQIQDPQIVNRMADVIMGYLDYDYARHLASMFVTTAQGGTNPRKSSQYITALVSKMDFDPRLADELSDIWMEQGRSGYRGS